MATFTPQAWPNLYNDQRNFIANLEQGLLIAEQQTLVPTTVKSSQPTDAEFKATWQLFFEAAVNIPTYGRSQWFNPNTNQIEGVYLPINDLGAGMSSNVLYELSKKARSSAWRFLGKDIADVSGKASLNVGSLDQSYSDLFFSATLRSIVAAATSNMNLRFNNLATNLYYTETLTGAAAAPTTAEAIGVSGLTLVCPAGSSEEFAFMNVCGFVHRYSAAAPASGLFMYNSVSGNPIATRSHAFASFIHNSAPAVASVDIVPVTASSIELGSSLSVWGIS